MAGAASALATRRHCFQSYQYVRAYKARTARAGALRAQAARAPPGAPSLAAQCLNVRCKKTYRAAQRTDRNAPTFYVLS